MSGRFSGLLLGNAFRVAINAFYEVDVVPAVFVLEGRIHLFHVESAIGKPWMARGAGCARLEAVLHVARQAAQSFVDSDGSAIVAGTDL